MRASASPWSGSPGSPTTVYAHSKNGENAFVWYASGFTDRAFATFSNLRYYGVFFDLPPVVVHRITGVDLWMLRHVHVLLFAVMTVAGVAHLTRQLSGPAAGFFAATALILTPRFFGHGFNNGKDVPMAACTVWAVVAAVGFAQRLPRPGWKTILQLGIWWGFALAVRISALSLAAVVAVACAAWWLSTDPRESLLRAAKVLAPSVAAVAAVAAIVMLPFWPFLQVSPVLGLAKAIHDQWRAGFDGILILYDGHVIRHLDAPAGYVWAWLVRITPEFYAVALVLAVIAAIQNRPWSRNGLIGWTTVLAAASMPFLIATATSPALYDGLRHFLFATVLLAVPVGAGVAWCVHGHSFTFLRAAGLALIVGSASLTLFDMIRIHPYQTAWFNRSVAGGLVGAAGRWDTDYWGNSLREGALWLMENVPPASPRPRVAGSATRPQTEHYLSPARFEFIGSVDEPPLRRHRYTNPPDYYLGFTRWNHDQIYPGAVIHRVERDGVTFVVVVKVDRNAALRLQPTSPRNPK